MRVFLVAPGDHWTIEFLITVMVIARRHIGDCQTTCHNDLPYAVYRLQIFHRFHILHIAVTHHRSQRIQYTRRIPRSFRKTRLIFRQCRLSTMFNVEKYAETSCITEWRYSSALWYLRYHIHIYSICDILWYSIA